MASATLNLPWVVLGPNSFGRDHGVLSLSPGLTLSAAEQERLHHFTLSAAAAVGRQAPRATSFFRLDDSGTSRWLIARTGFLRDAELGPMIVSWALVLTAADLDAFEWAPHRLLTKFTAWEAPATAPAPLSASAKLAPVEMREDLAALVEELALRATLRPLAVSVAAPWSAEELAVGVMETLSPGRRAHGWTTTGQLAASGGFAPAKVFRWIFAPTIGRAPPGHDAVVVNAKGLEGGAEVPIAQRTWYWLTKGARQASSAGGEAWQVDEILAAYAPALKAGADPANDVAFVILSALKSGNLDTKKRLLELLAVAAGRIPAARKSERFFGSHAVSNAFEAWFEEADAGVRLGLFEAYLDRIAPALPNAPATLPVRLALRGGLLSELSHDRIEALAADLANPKNAMETADGLAGLDAFGRAALGRTAVDGLRAGETAPAVWRLASESVRLSLDDADGADETMMADGFAILAQSRSWPAAPLLGAAAVARLERRIGKPRVRAALRPLLAWTAAGGFAKDATNAREFETMIAVACLSVAALEDRAR